MDVGTFLSGIRTVDLLIVVFFIGFFVLGFVQGTIRRLLGIASVAFSFLFAANVAGPLGEFLGNNWTQFPREYSYMVGFGTIYLAATLAFALVIQGFYKPQPLFAKARFADEIIGGFLGLIEAFMIFGVVLIILDSFFHLPGFGVSPYELPLLRDFWGALDGAKITEIFRAQVIPFFFLLTGLFIPDRIRALYPSF